MKSLLRFFRYLCMAYTVTSLLFLLLNLAIAGSLENTVIHTESFLLVFPFAAGVALASLVYGAKQTSHGLRLVLHFAMCALSAFFFLYLPAGTGAGAGMKFLMFLLIALVYWLVMGPYLAFTAKTRHRAAAAQDYQRVFKK